MTSDTYTPVNPDIPLLAHASQYGDTVARLMLGEMARRRRSAWRDYVLMDRDMHRGWEWAASRSAYRACSETYRCSKLGQYGCNETR